jgi:predicted Fe-Mo cluster-binding NifX family protein
MIAMPIKSNSKESALTTVFGKTKYFALVDEQSGEITVKENPFDSGRTLSEWFVDSGVDKVIVKSMGANPFLILHNSGVEVYICREKRSTIEETVALLREGKTTQVTTENMGKYLDAGGHRHAKGEHHDHEHAHGHDH